MAPYIYKTPVQWGDMDALGHGGLKTHEEISCVTSLVAAEVNMKYIKQIVFPDNVQIVTECESIGNTSISLVHKIISDKVGLCAIGKVRMVCVDSKTQQKVSVPQIHREIYGALIPKESPKL